MEYCPSGKIFTDLVLLLFRANGDLVTAGNRLSKEQGLTSSKWLVMSAIASRPQTVSDIARTMGLTRQSVQRSADLLVQAGICNFLDNPSHKAAMLLKLTASGSRKMKAMDKIQVAWANGLAQILLRKDMEAAVRVLRALVDELSRSADA